MNSNTYIPLRVQSNYSLLHGASSIQDLARQCAQLHLPGMALTDQQNLYGAISFFHAGEEQGLSAVLGAQLQDTKHEVLLLSQNDTGYANLCELLSRYHLNSDFSLCRELPTLQQGLFILIRDPRTLRKLLPHLDQHRLYVEICRPMPFIQEARLQELAERHALPLVATNNVLAACPAHLQRLPMLQAIRCNCSLSETKPAATKFNHLLSPDEFAHLFRDIPQAITATYHLANQCNLSLLRRQPTFPSITTNGAEELTALTYAGAARRYSNFDATTSERIHYELTIIIDMGFADYFLLVADITRHARELGTPIAGRGSGASSIVAYCLGITNVNPIQYHLPFERFLNRERADYPDLDIDLCWRLRDEVIDYVYRQYGADHVAMIATHSTLRPRAAFRLTAKALGLPREVITRTQHILQHYPSADKLIRNQKLIDLPGDSETTALALKYSHELRNFPHHLSIHPGGIIITPNKISRHAPLQRAAKGVIITQFEKNAVEEIGLIKIDLLGNRALSNFAEASLLVGARHNNHLHTETLPESDQKTADLLTNGQTLGINQLESPAMRHLLKQLSAATPGDLMKALALIRPGAASLGMKQAFIRRARGLENVPPIDPRLDDILQETYGIMLYEDEALQIIAALTGMPPGQADKFRKAISKCFSDSERLKLSTTFLRKCRDNNVQQSIATDLWVQMAKFNAYSFCRAHAASYARLAWANAYMKAHYPLEFWIGALNNNQGMYEKWVYLEEAKCHNINVLPPCINHSQDEFAPQGNSIRIGLNQIRSLSQQTRRAIIDKRPFAGLFDLTVRTKIRRNELHSLILVGALDFTGLSRPQLILQLDQTFDFASCLRGSDSLFPFCDFEITDIPLPTYDQDKQFADEWKLLGLAPHSHPIARFRPLLMRNGYSFCDTIPDSIDQHLNLCGMLAACRTLQTDSDGRMCFMTISDERGLFEVTLPPDVYGEHKRKLARTESIIFCISGQVRNNHGSLSIHADRICPLDHEELIALNHHGNLPRTA